MATEGGAATTDFGATIGRLAPGSAADLVLIDRRQFSSPYLDADTPLIDAVVQRAKTGVHTVMVAGEVILANRRFTRLDKEAALAEPAAQLSRPLTPEEERRRGISGQVAPYVRDFYRDYLPEERQDPFYVTSARY